VDPAALLVSIDEALAMEPGKRQAMANAALEANRNTIDMDHCVTPLVSWLRARIR
jgi:hypothetical protein